ncbi:MAG: TorF family putative porin [Pseudomonadota bacterium]
MSKINKSLVAASVLAAIAASGSAMAEVSMNIGATSNYIWRGVTQSGNDAALSGGLDYAHDSGFYAGTWTSSLGGGLSGGLEELDWYAGFAGGGDTFGYDVNLTAYTYPQMEDSDFTELGASVSYSMFTVGLNSTVASDVDDADGSAESFIEGDLYTYVAASFSLENDYSFDATFGNYAFDDDGVNGAELDYTHYRLAVTKAAGNFGDITLAYDATDMDDDPATVDTKEDGALVSLSWSKSF